jgi:two-component system, NarL family, nitrate/nitrite response regulator NarL
MIEKITIAVVDDHPMVREGVIHVIETDPEFEVVAQGASAHEAVEIAKYHKPKILVLDISIPGGGLTAVQSIVKLELGCKILMLTVSDDESDVFAALDFGSHGYVLKGISGSELLHALRTVHLDGHYLSPSLGAKMLTAIGRNKKAPKEEKVRGLNSREVEVYALVSVGHSNKEIGLALNISEKTVKHYMTNLFKKLHVKSRTQLALLAQQLPRATDQ